MAETAGLVIGTVSLAGLFTNCIECYNYIRIGQGLEAELPIYQTELAVLELRFSRWAQAVTELSTAKPPAISNDVAPLVKKILTQIFRLFERAKEDAEDDDDIVDSRMAIESSSQPQNRRFAKFYDRLKAIINHRQKTTKSVGYGQKMQWAIYKREDFTTLITNIRTKVDDLEILIPSTKLTERIACLRLEDAKEISRECLKDAELVMDSVRDTDPDLEMNIQQVSLGHRYSKTQIAELANVQMGDAFAKGYTGPVLQARNSYHETRIDRKANVTMGNTYGRTVFDNP